MDFQHILIDITVDGDKVADASEQHKNVPNRMMVPDTLIRIKNGADTVEQPPYHDPGKCFFRQMRIKGFYFENGHPAHAQIDQNGNHSVFFEHHQLVQNPCSGDAPNDKNI